MFVLSEIHDWQGDIAVKQILVFSNQEVKEMFEQEMLNRFNKAMDNYTGVDPSYSIRVKNDLSDTNAGAIYKLRAVKDSNGKWVPVIRCGFTGKELWESHERYHNPETALSVCDVYLKQSIVNSAFF